ncbi:hypothetical protein DFH29DRAFT_1079459 [Suillus ampliporus]|nr:hypothetical protein DFH29DRAFT_1079459 [Suillus ampliporus]
MSFLRSCLISRSSHLPRQSHTHEVSTPENLEVSQSQTQPRPRVKKVIRRPKVLGYVTSPQWLYQWGLDHDLHVYEKSGKVDVWNTKFKALQTIKRRANGAAKYRLVLDPNNSRTVVTALTIAHDARPCPPETVERRKKLLQAAMEITEEPTWLQSNTHEVSPLENLEISQSQTQPRPRAKKVIRRPKVLGYITAFEWLYQWGLDHNLHVYEEDGEVDAWNTKFEAVQTILRRTNRAAKYRLVLDPNDPRRVVTALTIANDARPSPPEVVEA